jgi:pimeloyl-ACP methyl ester carboxylesterase
VSLVPVTAPAEPEGQVQAFTPRRLLPLALVLPHSVGAWVRSARRPTWDVLPRAPLGARQIGELVLDELVIAANALVRSVPQMATLETSVEEATEVATGLAARTPEAPRPLAAPDVVASRSRGLRFEHLRFETGFLPPPELESRAPWLLGPPNGTAHARILRHRGAPRPWVVCIHGVSQGRPDDLLTFRARHLFAGLGLNVALPVLPLHGPRATGVQAVPGFDILDNIAASLQAVADIRRLMTWLQAEEGQPVVAYGVSLGGFVTSLLASAEPRLAGAVVAVPLVNMHSLLAWHLRRSGGSLGRSMARVLGSPAVTEAAACIDPLALRPQLPPERLAIVAALNDRVTSSRATHALWEHWGRPPLSWYPGGHVGHLWAGELRDTLDRTLSRLTGMPVPPADHDRNTTT